MSDRYFVETDGPDGLKHHVGPFKTRLEAEEWIARQAKQSEPDSPAKDNIIVFRR